MANINPASRAATASDIALARAKTGASAARKSRNTRKLIGATLTHIVLIFASIVLVFPVLWVVSLSFKKQGEWFTITPSLIPRDPTLQNYVQAVTGAPFLSWFWNSFAVALGTTFVGLLIALPAGYALSRFEFLGKQGVLLSFLVTQMFPGALLLVPLYNIFLGLGMLNNPYALIIAYATTALPFSVYMLKNFFDAIPQELDQAGLVDGLNTFGVFWRIVAPLTLPGIAVAGFFNFMTAWNEFMLARAFLTDNTALTLPVGLYTWVNQFEKIWGPLAATSVLITIPVFVMFIFAQRYLITGLTGGSVKG